MTSGGGIGRAVSAARIRLISGMVSGIMPGSAGGGACVSVRARSAAAAAAQTARAAMTSTTCRKIGHRSDSGSRPADLGGGAARAAGVGGGDARGAGCGRDGRRPR
jgi:hypothetical protein